MLEIANNISITKRNVLGTLPAFCDPLGFIQPILMSMKIFFQKFSISQLEDDAELPDSKTMKWQKFVEVWKTEEVVNVGWKYSTKAVDEDEILGTELHGFGDTYSHGLLP